MDKVHFFGLLRSRTFKIGQNIGHLPFLMARLTGGDGHSARTTRVEDRAGAPQPGAGRDMNRMPAIHNPVPR